MSMTYDDYARERAIDDLHDEAVMERAKWEQCIYLFVEGESEKVAFPELLEDSIDLDKLGVVVAVYNGNGNLYTALNLLSQTLSYDRPVVATYDNDPDGIRALQRYQRSDFTSDRIHFFPIPKTPVVEYPGGHHGGSFEESFETGDFLEACFDRSIVPEKISRQRDDFKGIFEPSKPWLEQVRKYCARHDFKEWKAKKPVLAEYLATHYKTIPETYIELAGLIQRVRDEHPVRHPDDVELPKVHGLTYWPKKDNGQQGAPTNVDKPRG